VWQLSEVQPNVATEATLQTKYFMYNTSDDLILRIPDDRVHARNLGSQGA